MNSTSAKRRVRLLSFALAALLAWPWAGAASVSPLGGTTDEPEATAGLSRIARPHRSAQPDALMDSAPGFAVTDDENEAPPEIPRDLSGDWLSLGAITELATDSSGATQGRGDSQGSVAVRHLRC